MDRVALRGLKARGHHGVFPREREEGQTFIVDLVLGLDTRPAAADDDLAKTVHYGIVAEEVVAVVQGEPVDLGGYYVVDRAKADEVMRPSATFNRAIDALAVA